MDEPALASLSAGYLARLCLPEGRPPGSGANRSATADLAREFSALGLRVDCPEFDCLTWTGGAAALSAGGTSFAVHPSPFGLGCAVRGPLVVVTTVDELAAADLSGAVVLLRADIAREQLMPTNYPFYNPDEHRRIISLLNGGLPSAVVSAPAPSPTSVGAVYPYPLIEDGDFNIPLAHMTAEEGQRLAALAGRMVDLQIVSARTPSRGANVVAHAGPPDARRVVVCAHIDSRAGTPGALDNGAGVTVLLLLAELLRGYIGGLGVELLAVNGEDYYAASGELLYLEQNRGQMDRIALAVNLDAAGYVDGRTAWSLYGVPDVLADSVRRSLASWPGLMEGEPWYQSDHMVFAQNGVPAMAVTSERFLEIQARFAHSPEDLPALVDVDKVVETARALHALIASLP